MCYVLANTDNAPALHYKSVFSTHLPARFHFESLGDVLATSATVGKASSSACLKLAIAAARYFIASKTYGESTEVDPARRRKLRAQDIDCV